MSEGHQFLFRVIFVTAALVATYNAYMLHKEVFDLGPAETAITVIK